MRAASPVEAGYYDESKGGLPMKRTLLMPAVCAAMFAVFGAVTLPAHEAQATTVAELSESQLADASTYIVLGTVEDIWVERDGNGLVWTRVRLAVSETIKGPDSPKFLIIDNHGGKIGTFHTEVEGVARFSVGETALVFLDELQTGRYTPVALHRGKLTVRRAPGERRNYLLRWQGRHDDKFDARFLVHPPADERVYMDTFMDDLRTRLTEGWDGRAIPGLSEERLKTINAPERRILR